MTKNRCLIFDGWNTAIDGHFTLSKLSFPLPEIAEQRQEIAGMDGALDYTEAAFGRPIYKTRELSAMLSSTWGSREDRLAVFRELVHRVHGKQCTMELPDRPGFTARGRVSVTLQTDNPKYTEVGLDAVCDPFLTSKTPELVSAPLLPRTANALTENNVTLVNELTTADGGDYYASTFKFIVRSGEIGCAAVWRIALEPNRRYFVAARTVEGRGAWSVSTDPTAQNWGKGFITTGSGGTIYLRMEKYSQEAFSIVPLLVLPVGYLTTIDAGPAAATATAKFSGSINSLSTFGILLNDTLRSVAALDNFEWALPPETSAAAFVLLSGSAEGALDIKWRKVEL